MSLARVGRVALSAAVALAVFLAITELAAQLYTRWHLSYHVEMSRYAAEVKVESRDPRIGHVHRPGVKCRLMGVAVEINADGLRDREYATEKHGLYRIVVLGDSLTFGWGVEKPETFEEILERELGRIRPTEVLNFGTGNYNTDQQVRLFLERGVKYDPDRVLLFYFINDAEPTPRRSSWSYIGRLRSATLFWSRVQSALSRFEPERSYDRYYRGLYAADQPGWVRTQQALIELARFCGERGIGLQVFLLPELHQLVDYPFAAEHAQVLGVLERQGIAGVDLAPDFAGERDPRRLWVAPDDAHPNREAHALIARYALPHIVRAIQDAR